MYTTSPLPDSHPETAARRRNQAIRPTIDSGRQFDSRNFLHPPALIPAASPNTDGSSCSAHLPGCAMGQPPGKDKHSFGRRSRLFTHTWMRLARQRRTIIGLVLMLFVAGAVTLLPGNRTPAVSP